MWVAQKQALVSSGFASPYNKPVPSLYPPLFATTPALRRLLAAPSGTRLLLTRHGSPIFRRLSSTDIMAETQSDFAKQRALVDDLTKRRFFYRAAFDIYGGTAGLMTYGPPGCALKTNLCQQWRKHFIIEDSMMEIEDPTVTPYHVLDASGHVERFNDFMVKDVKDGEPARPRACPPVLSAGPAHRRRGVSC